MISASTLSVAMMCGVERTLASPLVVTACKATPKAGIERPMPAMVSRVFDRTPSFLASDCARMGTWLSVKEYDVRESQRHLDVSTEATLAIPFVRWQVTRGSGGS